MKNVYIYCEGQTEETFVNEILYPFFMNVSIYVIPIVCSTKHRGNLKYRGGVSSYQKIRRELIKICKSHRNEFVTTMFDYYAMPEDTPGIENMNPDLYTRIREIEDAVDQDISEANCSFHFMVHEFEAVLFSQPQSFCRIASADIVDSITEIKDQFPTPEYINKSVETAPSKRLARLIPGYAKVRDSAILSKDMGIDVIMDSCPHFKEWIESIISL